jgi:hypothetical protein
MLRFTKALARNESGGTSIVCSLLAALVAALLALSSSSTSLAEILDLVVGAL